jgi:Endoplasmic Reticulum-Golgi Intermediate Compartment (ERGIC)
MRVETKSELVVDRSRHGELLRINFNMSFPQLSCEFATVDVSDALGTVWRRALLTMASPAALPL